MTNVKCNCVSINLWTLMHIYVFFIFSAPYTVYSFTVTGITPAGSGPMSDKVSFMTPQGCKY